MGYLLLWILSSTWLVLSGWGLSALQRLDLVGYSVSIVGLGGLLIAAHLGLRLQMAPNPRRLVWRFRRALPLVYLACLAGALIGGALYSPTNYDAICYRLPRILHWWNEHQWHWIGGWNNRMDYSATGFEWLMLPSLCLFKTDRLFFLANIVSYALMPGALYSTLVGLGISRRVAWCWMWLFPTSYCYVTQAGSIGNDSFAAVYFLIAMAYALRAKQSGSLVAAGISILAAGLLTGSKASNIPLLLPIAFVLVPALYNLRQRAVWLLPACLVGASVSFLPMAAINTAHTGDWSGDPHNSERMKLDNPAYGIIGNILQVSAGAIAPPVFPMAGAWNQLTSNEFKDHPLKRYFPRFSLKLTEIPSEESAGLGFGVSGVALVSLIADLWVGGLRTGSRMALWAGLGCWLALGVFTAKMGSESAPRLLAAYYPGILISLLALNSQASLVRQRWWKTLALLGALCALPAVILSPARPLAPITALLDLGKTLHFPKGLLDRALLVYTQYGNRSDNLAVVREQLPPTAKVIGFAGTGDESELSFWKPFQGRRVLDLNPIAPQGPQVETVEAIVGSEWGFGDRFGLSAADFAEKIGGRVVWSQKVVTHASAPPLEWSVIVPAQAGLPFKVFETKR